MAVRRHSGYIQNMLILPFLSRRIIKWALYGLVALLLYGTYLSGQARQAAMPKPRHDLASVRIYPVVSGDTLLAIAIRHGYSDAYEGVWKIEKANHLTSPDIYPNQKLILP